MKLVYDFLGKFLIPRLHTIVENRVAGRMARAVGLIVEMEEWDIRDHVDRREAAAVAFHGILHVVEHAEGFVEAADGFPRRYRHNLSGAAEAGAAGDGCDAVVFDEPSE